MRMRKKSGTGGARDAMEGSGPAVRSGREAAQQGGNPDGRKGKAAMRNPATDRILAVIKAIPKGKVAAYGQVAALAGVPRGARQVARVLHSLSGKEKLPWHRVIGASGRISLPAASGGAEQARRLKREGVAVDARGRVDLARFRWDPGE
jgi:methylated-DNA-protein-cysteine methyltransferase-like protein